MKIDKLCGERFKERPSDCVVDSHALMLRGGYMKGVANGIYSQFMPLKRITNKIEDIIRKEMDAIDGQEVLFPVVMPAALWDESGRYESVGSELLRFTDRTGSKMVLGMTHEEAAVHLVRDYANSYAKYPFMIYQIQTKFRDEARPRAGLIRVREFTMKDAYSFHTSQEDLEKYYDVVYKAYERIYAKAGLPDVMVVQSDSGMMGGAVSHEYMCVTPIGEDSLAVCSECDFKSNVEAAKSIIENERTQQVEIQEVHTPNLHTIEEVCEFVKYDTKNSIKAVVYQKETDDKFVVVFLRGDLEINETKLTSLIGDKIYPANITEETGIAAGFIGVLDFKPNVPVEVYYDNSLKGLDNCVTGANKTDYHITGVCVERDLKDIEFNDLAKAIDGGICPCCGKKSLKIVRGIEVGNIFQLGTKYTKSMNMTYLDQNGEEQYPIMGCYGIGVGRLAASVCEKCHDDYGPVWPITIAPWQVHLCCLRADDEATKAAADKLYADLQSAGVEVIYDDRDIRAGAMFSDADLLGVPVRVVVSPRNLEKGEVEISTRDKKIKTSGKVETAVDDIKAVIKTLFDEIEENVKKFN